MKILQRLYRLLFPGYCSLLDTHAHTKENLRYVRGLARGAASTIADLESTIDQMEVDIIEKDICIENQANNIQAMMGQNDSLQREVKNLRNTADTLNQQAQDYEIEIRKRLDAKDAEIGRVGRVGANYLGDLRIANEALRDARAKLHTITNVITPVPF